ncbi:MAG: hypothetical protein KDC61_07405 [Saprospiraceae bacterium]|nr:hypothetical protein [Saprospiraceae bacterium]MCB0574376.1 hypothetical protein [Saprospiraceae bacterium]
MFEQLLWQGWLTAANKTIRPKKGRAPDQALDHLSKLTFASDAEAQKAMRIVPDKYP